MAINNQLLNNSFDITPIEDNEIDEQKYKKLNLTKDQKASMGLFINQLPNLINSAISSNAYLVSFPDGIQHALTPLKQGGFMSNYRNASGQFMGTASLHPLEAISAVSSAFSIMSIATGQYYLSEINQELNLVNSKLDKIIDFLYGDKKAELISELKFVNQCYESYSSIMAHNEQRIATIASLQESKKLGIKNIEFYMSDLNSILSKEAKNHSDFEQNSEEAFKTKANLELSIQLYIISSLMEIHFSQNYDKEYIEPLKDDLIKYVNLCDKRILSIFSSLKAKYSSFKPNMINKFDTSILENKFNSLIDSFDNGEESKVKISITHSVDSLFNKKEYLVKDNEVYLRCN